ncbi:hypothetical protein L3Q72_21855 [Vibrio sp. JC009]|uniref:hypothetical protein n=1 Tax=Vibrio sp. JC009 TaxID=2912314 RepID=UPI0023AF31D9|nr:hypothetical protein [Vibrio sp. JC009]WED23881.1 hypothetical protein L3Q72_21855 [Vibrio sp. JC009]
MEHKSYSESEAVTGQFVDLDGERFYKIENVDQMPPFFISVVSASNHWLFISSTGSLSAGRIRPENALFPYKSVDHIHENSENTGSKTIVRIKGENGTAKWEPFNEHHNGLYEVERNLYKNAVGDKITFEEINRTLGIKFQYSWNTSEQFGFIRKSALEDLSGADREIELLDGIQNLLPSGAPLGALQTRSALVDAYKWNEQVEESPLALFTMYATLSDKAEPAESLRATTVFNVGDKDSQILLSSRQVNAFRKGAEISNESLTKGLRGAYFVHKTVALKANSQSSWMIVADIDKTHADIAKLKQTIKDADLEKAVEASVAENHNELVSLMSGADAWQLTSEENTSVHHYANVLFNNMRGGVFENNYDLDKADVYKTMLNANKRVVERNQAFFDALPERFTNNELVAKSLETGDAQLTRLCYEYLPLTFGRRHGDPSRPWNHYEIKVRDENGDRLLSYQGNWRDIFQNWEASALSYPEFVKSFIAKFVNASTADGYNPYRITKDGIDWEVIEPDDPWSNIGYWGDHQIIYLLKFLELADKYQQDDLIALLSDEVFSYANVPYELCGVDALFNNPKDTVNFNDDTQAEILRKVAELGSDGRLILDSDNEVYQVNLLEKVLVPLLAKLSNLVLDGGIWLNTQRPEWNDANNAIVGNGLSMVTLYYMRRYVAFMQKLMAKAPSTVSLSNEVADWMIATTAILDKTAQEIRRKTVTRQTSRAILTQLEKAADDYRQKIYRKGFSGKTGIELAEVIKLMDVSLEVLDSSIANNKREDGLYNAYNIINYSADQLSVEELYPMLEGQVSILSAGSLSPKETVALLDSLFASDMYREDQKSFMLYPDRDLTAFVGKNAIPAAMVKANALLAAMAERGDTRILNSDIEGGYHFNADFENAGFLEAEITALRAEYAEVSEDAVQGVYDIYEEVFNHRAFTGRSGTMFGYEGLGCIYWHMVSKLLLAVQENYQAALEQDPASEETAKLAEYYYRVREGIGFNKTPENYGAFPTDPYSHTPKHAGAQQPGMTGQVKEEIITRFGELGLIVKDAAIEINPTLLNRNEFISQSLPFRFENVKGDKMTKVIPEDGLAFTYCQVPFVYQQLDAEEMKIEVTSNEGETLEIAGSVIPANVSKSIFMRDGKVESVKVYLPKA